MTNPLRLPSGVARLVEYDERWPALFATEAQRLFTLIHGKAPFIQENLGRAMCAT